MDDAEIDAHLARLMGQLQRMIPPAARSSWVDREDVEGEARLAMLVALRRYDPATEVPVGTWVAVNVRSDVTDYLRSRYGRTGSRRRAAVSTAVLDDRDSVHDRGFDEAEARVVVEQIEAYTAGWSRSRRVSVLTQADPDLYLRHVGDALGICQAAVHRHRSRGNAELAKRFAVLNH